MSAKPLISDAAKTAVVFAAVSLGLVFVAHAQAQEINLFEANVTCPHAKRWKPTEAELKQILTDHQQWLAGWKKTGFQAKWLGQQGRAYLCNANLSGAQLNGANLMAAQLNKAILAGAQLNGANLSVAQLNGHGGDLPCQKDLGSVVAAPVAAQARRSGCLAGCPGASRR